MTTKKIDLNWYSIANDCIDLYYECPLCVFRDVEEDAVVAHIRQKHTKEEIKEACSN